MEATPSNGGPRVTRPVSEANPPAPEEHEIQQAVAEVEAALDALRRAQSLWVGARPWSGGRTWDVTLARQALEDAETRLHAARGRLNEALALARRRELRNGAQS